MCFMDTDNCRTSQFSPPRSANSHNSLHTNVRYTLERNALLAKREYSKRRNLIHNNLEERFYCPPSVVHLLGSVSESEHCNINRSKHAGRHLLNTREIQQTLSQIRLLVGMHMPIYCEFSQLGKLSDMIHSTWYVRTIRQTKLF